MTPLAPDLSAFLQKHLPHERGASQHTIAAYAHAFTLLLRFAATRLKRQPSDLLIEDLDVRLIRAFLEHIEDGSSQYRAIPQCPAGSDQGVFPLP